MSGQHRAGPPEDCASCRKLFAVLAEHHQAQPDVRLTAVQIGARCGDLSRVTVQRHLSHLVQHRRIKADGRTPVSGATVRQGGEVPEDADALTWAVNVATPDQTCGRLLVGLARAAGGRWAGQVSTADLATAAGATLRTAKRHRPHLVSARLVEFRPVTVLARDGRHRIRHADRFRFLSGVAVPIPEASTWEGGRAMDAAKSLVDSVPWFCASPADMTRAYRLVAARLMDGWPYDELLRLALVPEPEGYVANPYGLLSSRLPAPRQQYVIPAEQMVRGESGKPRCTSCGLRMNPTPDGLCRDCREDQGAAVPLARTERVEAERMFAAFRSA